MTQVRPTTLPVWAETGDVTQPTNPEISAGWPLTSTPPSRQRFNWILNFIANGMRYLLQRGIAEWAASESYPIGGRVQYNTLTYRALTANTNKQPDTNPTDWALWANSTFTGGSATATAGQTVFNIAHTPNGTMVFRNGSKVPFTSSGGGTTITLALAANAGDFVEVISL